MWDVKFSTSFLEVSLGEFQGGTKKGPSLIYLSQDVIGKMTTAQLAEVFSDNCYVHTSTFMGLFC